MTHEDERRAIDLADAASRAMGIGNHAVADRLNRQAEKLLGAGQTFEEWITPRGYNLEQYQGAYVSKMTQELYDCWLAASGAEYHSKA